MCIFNIFVKTLCSSVSWAWSQEPTEEGKNWPQKVVLWLHPLTHTNILKRKRKCEAEYIINFLHANSLLVHKLHPIQFCLWDWIGSIPVFAINELLQPSMQIPRRYIMFSCKSHLFKSLIRKSIFKKYSINNTYCLSCC